MSSIVFYFISVSVSVLILYVLYLLFHGNDTFFGLKRLYLIGIVVFSLIIPLIDFSISETNSVEYSYVISSITIYADSINDTIDNQVKIRDYLSWIYLIGVALFATRFIVMLTSLFLKIRKSEKVLIHGRKIYIAKESDSHYSFLGMIFIGGQENGAEMERIIEHEHTHIKKGHTLDVLFLEVVGILFWFNPVLFLIKRSIKIIHEYQVDNELIEGGVNRLEYQKLLLSTAMGVRTSFLMNGFNKSFLKKRFLMMSKLKSPAWLRLKLILFLPFLVGIPFLFSCVKEQMDNKGDLIGVELKSESQSNRQARDVEDTNYNYFSVKVAPQFPGGEDQLIKYISANIRYPEEAKMNGIEGKVFVRFIVSKSGKVKNISIKKGIHKLLDKEALRVIAELEDWTPGINESGEPVNVEMVIPINFRLN